MIGIRACKGGLPMDTMTIIIAAICVVLLIGGFIISYRK